MMSFRSLSLTSSCLFLIGAALALFVYIFSLNADVSNPNVRSSAVTVEIVSWTVMAASVIPEMVIDIIIKERPMVHGRYGKIHTTTCLLSRVLNWLQTVTFTLGVVVQGIAGKRLWDDGPGGVENVYLVDWFGVSLFSGVMLTLSGVFAEISVGCCCYSTLNDGSNKSSVTIVQTTNALYFIGCIALIVVSFGSCDTCFLGYFIAFGVRALFCLVGTLWIIADAKMSDLPAGESFPIHTDVE